MDVTKEDVLRCARLTNLHLQESEVEPMRQAMTKLLTHAESLNALDLTDVEPTFHALPIALPRREDVVRESFTQAQALANAPAVEQGHFLVPKVF